MVETTEEMFTDSSTAAAAPHRSPTPELHATYTSFEILVALVAVVGNAMVIHVFRRDRRLRRRTNYYIVSLAVADFLVGLLGIPFAILASVGLPRNLHACLFTVSLLVMLCTISIFCLVAVSVDRYWAILYPMCYSRNVRTRTAVSCECEWGRQSDAGESPLTPGELTTPVRSQSRVGIRPSRCTMKSFYVILVYTLFTNAVLVCGKISGGPRGRFSGNHGRPHGHHVSAHHPHYTYHPPSHIYFTCKRCSSYTVYPVYHGTPPTYVYKYREYGGRYGDLLTGLALYNLGRAANEQWHYTLYERRPDEKCSMQVIDRNQFEETIFPCFMMSSFVDSSDNYLKNQHPLDITTVQINVRAMVHDNGTGVKVTKNQECVIWHNSTIKNEHVIIPCALLKEYADTMKPHGVPVYIWLPLTLATVMGIYIFCQSFFKQKKTSIDETPCNPTIANNYFSNNNSIAAH